MSNTTKANKPTHAVYHLRGEGKSAYWTKIGAAWLHDDKEGLNLSLDLVPVGSTGRLVIRVNKADDAKSSTPVEAA
jgi:hypothetical protein